MNGHKNKTISTVFAALIYWAISAAAYADPVTLDDVNFAALPGDRFQVVMTFSDTPPEVADLAMANPASLVLDFPGVQSKLAQKRYALSFENARSLTALTAGERTRVVLSLHNMAPYQTSVNGNVFTLEVGTVASQVAETARASAVHTSGFDGAVSGDGVSITNVDFQRGDSGEGSVAVELSDSNVNVDIDHVGNEIRINFYQTGLPENLDRRLDVVDFATPVKAIDSSSRGSTTQIVISALGEYEYSAYQVDTRYVVDVKPLTAREQEERRDKFAYTGNKLTLNFQDISVRSVLSLIADQSGFNVVVSDAVDGSITLNLTDVPWDHALDVILKTKGLDKRQEGNVIHIGLAEDIAERERLQVEVNKQLQELAPLRTEFIRINYADAQAIFNLYQGDSTSNDLDRGEIRLDERTNTIILTDTAENIDNFRRLVKELDIPIRQVKIEARIVVAESDFREELGVEWGVGGSGTFNGNQLAGGGPLGPLGLQDLVTVNLGAAESTGSVALSYLADNIFLDLELSAMESSGTGDLIAQPSVTTGDKQEAVISTGQSIPYLTAQSGGAGATTTTVEFEEALLELKVTPQITPDNRINMNLEITQDAQSGEFITSNSNSVPIIDRTGIETTALVGNGQTIVLGGVFQLEEIKTTRKVPVLGDIPYVGRLFKSELEQYEKREILIFITPKIIDEALID